MAAHRVQLDRRPRAEVDDLEDFDLCKLVELLQVTRELLVAVGRLARRRELGLAKMSNALARQQSSREMSGGGALAQATKPRKTHRVDDGLEPKQLLAVNEPLLVLALGERPAEGRVLLHLTHALKLELVGLLNVIELWLERSQVEKDLVRRHKGRSGVEDLGEGRGRARRSACAVGRRAEGSARRNERPSRGDGGSDGRLVQSRQANQTTSGLATVRIEAKRSPVSLECWVDVTVLGRTLSKRFSTRPRARARRRSSSSMAASTLTPFTDLSLSPPFPSHPTLLPPPSAQTCRVSECPMSATRSSMTRSVAPDPRP